MLKTFPLITHHLVSKLTMSTTPLKDLRDIYFNNFTYKLLDISIIVGEGLTLTKIIN